MAITQVALLVSSTASTESRNAASTLFANAIGPKACALGAQGTSYSLRSLPACPAVDRALGVLLADSHDVAIDIVEAP